MVASFPLPKTTIITPSTTAPQPQESQTLPKSLLTTIATPNAAPHRIYTNQKNATLFIDEIEMNETLYLKELEGCTVTVNALCVKILVEKCTDTTITLNGRVLTHILECWSSKNCTIWINSPIKTCQIDIASNIKIHYSKKRMFQQLIWANCNTIDIVFKDSQDKLETGMDREKLKIEGLHEDIDQFIIRYVKNAQTGKEELISELMVRLANGFPTTEREAEEFDARQEKNLLALAKEVLGADIVLGPKKSDLPSGVIPREEILKATMKVTELKTEPNGPVEP